MNRLVPPLRIGTHEIWPPVVLAPMSGVTNRTLRALYKPFGFGLTVTEFVSSNALAFGAKRTMEMIDQHGVEQPVSTQLWGNDPELMARAARVVRECGADIVDINFGCPVRKVAVGQQAGSALMRDLDHALRLIEATVTAVRVPVTLKMRLGWDGQSVNAPELGRLAEAEGIAMLTVHGRTRCQFYASRADWAAIGAVKKAVSIPVVANGDCASLADAASMLAQSGADAVMIGRSAIGRPWFVGDVAHYLAQGKARAETPPAARKSAALEHFETLLEILGPGHGVRHARKHLAAYAELAGVRDGAAFRQRLVRLECPSAVRVTLCQLFDSPLLIEAA